MSVIYSSVGADPLLELGASSTINERDDRTDLNKYQYRLYPLFLLDIDLRERTPARSSVNDRVTVTHGNRLGRVSVSPAAARIGVEKREYRDLGAFDGIGIPRSRLG